MKKKFKKNAPANYVSDLITTYPQVGLLVAYALECSHNMDQALACSRFTEQAYRLKIETYVRQAVALIGAGLDDTAAFTLTKKVATEAINDYSATLMASVPNTLSEITNKRFDA
jgi:hypothetical protein